MNKGLLWILITLIHLWIINDTETLLHLWDFQRFQRGRVFPSSKTTFIIRVLFFGFCFFVCFVFKNTTALGVWHGCTLTAKFLDFFAIAKLCESGKHSRFSQLSEIFHRKTENRPNSKAASRWPVRPLMKRPWNWLILDCHFSWF